MTVDDEAMFRINTEVAQDVPAKIPFMNEFEIRIFRLDPRFLLRHEVVLECGDFILAEKRRKGPTPKIPKHVEMALFFVAKCAMHYLAKRFKERPPPVRCCSRLEEGNYPIRRPGRSRGK